MSSAENLVTVDPAPVQGAESWVVVTDDIGRAASGVTIRVVHRPGLDGTRELAIGITDALGRVRWTPEAAGAALVQADDAQLPVEVAWAAPPSATIALMVMLAIGALAAIVGGLTAPQAWKPRA
jgi:hypothetical protein